MNKHTYAVMAGVLAAAGLGCGTALAAGDMDSHAQLLVRGKYLVTQAAPCGDCHTPRDARGQPNPDKPLEGAPIGFKPLHPIPGWKTRAPAIAGLPKGWSYDQTVYFLKTGIKPDGKQAGPPMPAFRFDEEDAQAIATYLQTLPGPDSAGQ